MSVSKNTENCLSKETVLLLTISALFTIGGLLSTTFVNVYIWRVDKDYVPVALFNLCNFIATPLFFIVAGWFAKKRDRVLALRIGIAIQLVFYVAVLLLGENAAHHVLWLGLLLGSGGGFYWLAYNLLSFELTDPDNRNRFNGISGVLGSLAGMVAPLFAGWIIAKMIDFRGYHLLFALSGLMFAGAVFMSFQLRARSARGPFLPWSIFRECSSDWWRLMIASACFGVREGVLAFYIGLLVYLVTKTELGLGKFALLTSTISLVMFFIAGRIKVSDPKRVRTFMLIGGVIMSVGAAILFIKVGYWSLIAFGVLSAIGTPFFTVPFSTMIFDEIGETRASANRRVEYIVMREIFLNAGRIVSIALFLTVWISFRTSIALQALVLFVGSIQIVSWYIAKSVSNARSRARAA